MILLGNLCRMVTLVFVLISSILISKPKMTRIRFIKLATLAITAAVFFALSLWLEKEASGAVSSLVGMVMVVIVALELEYIRKRKMVARWEVLARVYFAGWRFGQMGFVRISKPAAAMMIKINWRSMPLNQTRTSPVSKLSNPSAEKPTPMKRRLLTDQSAKISTDFGVIA